MRAKMNAQVRKVLIVPLVLFCLLLPAIGGSGKSSNSPTNKSSSTGSTKPDTTSSSSSTPPQTIQPKSDLEPPVSTTTAEDLAKEYLGDEKASHVKYGSK